MDDSNAVGIKIKTDTKQTISNLDILINKLDKTNDILTEVAKNTGFERTNNQLQGINKTLKNVDRTLQAPSLASYLTMFKKLGQETANYVDVSAEYLENLNLMQVAYGDNRKEAERLIDSLSSIFGLNESGLTRQLGIYRQLGNALSIDNEYAELLSENLLKMQLDVSSLYNLSFERAGTVLQASMAGQTKPIRGATGGDITQATLQTDLDRLGIDRQVASLNRGEKALLIYLSLERQLVSSQQDLAKTINSTSNQQKIFTEQTQRLAIALGNVVTPAFTKLLTYANGLLMVITELVNMFAVFIGFKVPEYDASDYKGFVDLSDYLDDSASSAGKLKKELNSLRGFEKLNAIRTPKDSSGTGGVSAGGIDKGLLKALKEYDLGLDSVQNKATAIRDAIMKWLGFTKDANGEWKFTKITLGTIVGTLLGAGGIVWGVNKVLGLLKRIGLLKFGSIGELAKNIGNIYKKVKDFGSILLKGDILSKLGISETATTVIGTVAGTIAYLVAQFWSYDGVWEQITKKGSLSEIFKIDNAKDLIQTIFTITSLLSGGFIPFLIIGEEKMSKLNGTTSVLKQTFEDCKSVVVDFAKQSGEKTKKLYDDNIKPTVSNIKKLYEEDIKPILKDARKLIDDIIIGSGLLKSVLGVLSEFIGGAFSMAFQLGFGTIRSVVEYAMTYVETKIRSVTGVINGVIQVITAIKDGDWSKAWSGMKNIVVSAFQGMLAPLKSVTNSILSMFETMSNAVVTGGNTIIKALNKLDVKVPKALQKLVGFDSFGFNIKTLSKIKLPRLEKGLDFVPKDFYGPVYLDYGERVLTKEENQKYNQSESFVNSKDIISNIRQATFNGMMDALTVTSQQQQNVNVTIVAEDDGILNSIKFKEKQRDRQYGF